MATVNRGRVLVVGGASGIGAACVTALAQDGWEPVVADLHPATDPVVRASARVDVRDAEAVDAAVAELAGGDGSLAGIVYAAGTARVAALGDISVRDWQLTLDVNLTGAFNVIRAGAPRLPRGAGIVLISSVDAVAPVSGLAAYCAAKAGVDALSRSTALELGPAGIRCNVVAPGVVPTPLMAPVLERPGVARAFVDRTPLGRMPDAAEIAAVVAFLVSPAASWVTGARIPVDGGLSLREHPSMLAVLSSSDPTTERPVP